MSIPITNIWQAVRELAFARSFAEIKPRITFAITSSEWHVIAGAEMVAVKFDQELASEFGKFIEWAETSIGDTEAIASDSEARWR